MVAGRARTLPAVIVSTTPIELPGLRVIVERVVHSTTLPAPPDKPHSFVYFITIHNESDRTVTIKGRKWVVSNGNGEVDVVEGDGVVGEFPRLAPGEHFRYNSRHITDDQGASATGAYLGVDDDGQRVVVRIPAFQMTVPE